MGGLARVATGPMKSIVGARAGRRAEDLGSRDWQRALQGLATCVLVIIVVLLVGGVLAAHVYSHIRPIFIH
jgi:hypothetical protein